MINPSEPEYFAQLQVIPPKLRELINRSKGNSIASNRANNDVTRLPLKKLKEMDFVIPEGERNNTFFSLSCHLFKKMDHTDATDLLFCINEKCCEPPLEDSELEQIINSAEGYVPTPLVSLDVSQGGKPTICRGYSHLDTLLDTTVEYLLEANKKKPFLFCLDNQLVEIRRHNALGHIKPAPVQYSRLRLIMAIVIDWVKQKDDKFYDVYPPTEIAKTIIDCPDQDWPFLRAIKTAPLFTASGELKATSGYDWGSQFYLDISEKLGLPELPEQVTEADIDSARQLLLGELLVDFPFDCDSSRTNVVAALLTPFVDTFVNGPKPLFLIDAACPSSGKTLLANTIGLIVQGKLPQMVTEAPNEDEMRKKITTLLQLLPELVVIDNINKKFNSGSFASMLTGMSWSDRKLGENTQLEFPVHAMWVVTGNNTQLSNELARRTVCIRIEQNTERPWLIPSENFKHGNLQEWALENRGRLLWAIYVLVLNWIQQGKPNGKKTLGSFEGWAKTIGGILECANIDGFLDNIDALYDRADVEGDEARTIFTVLWKKFESNKFTIKDAMATITEANLSVTFITDKGERSNATRTGSWFKKHDKRIFNNLRLLFTRKDSKGSAQYQLEPLGNGPVLTLVSSEDASVATIEAQSEEPFMVPPLTFEWAE